MYSLCQECLDVVACMQACRLSSSLAEHVDQKNEAPRWHLETGNRVQCRVTNVGR